MNGMFSIMQLTSLTAVVGAAVFLTWVTKRSLAMVPWANCVPVFVYTAIIAAILTYIANRVTHTLEGQTGILIVDAIINGALASGLREWFVTSTTPLSDSGTALKARAELKGDYVPPPRSWLLPLLLVGSLLAVPACSGGTIKPPVITPPVITPEDQAKVQDLAVKALAGFEVAGIVMRDGRQLVSDLERAGTPGVTREVRTAVNTAVQAANKVIQRVITDIDRAVKKVGQLGTLTDITGWAREGVNAFLDVARAMERQTDSRVTMAGRFIRSALEVLGGLVGIEVTR